jgi:BirA family biotin operon repressor/biotin-[acetyl-CoA-carboxylase] ligase
MTYGTPNHHLEECASTNDVAAEWAADPLDPAPDGAMVTADLQTKGRGRRGRTWDSGSGDNVIMSVILRDAGPSDTIWQLGFVCALAISDAFLAHGVDGRIKWPNDVLIESKKAAGVLIEVPAAGSIDRWLAIAGIGVNVNRAAFADASSFIMPPTSLYMETGVTISPRELADEIAHSLETWEKKRRAGEWPAILKELRLRLAEGVQLTRGGVTAVLKDVGIEGQAIVELISGTFHEWRTVDYEAGHNSV